MVVIKASAFWVYFYTYLSRQYASDFRKGQVGKVFGTSDYDCLDWHIYAFLLLRFSLSLYMCVFVCGVRMCVEDRVQLWVFP